MGRLTLNILLSFAQFEREVTAERIRDKIATSKRKGLWVGGMVPLGYDSRNRKIAVNEREAREAMALSCGMITMIDDAIGRVLGRLTACGLDLGDDAAFAQVGQ